MNRFAELLLLLALLGLGASANATTFRVLSLPEMIGAAELAFHGTVVTATESVRDGEPWTTVTFDVTEWFRVPEEQEENPEGHLNLSFLGGTVAGNVVSVALMPEFQAGEEVLILAYAQDYYSPLVGFNQGLWRLAADQWTDEQGRTLGLDEDGNLSIETSGPATEVKEELAARLGAR